MINTNNGPSVPEQLEHSIAQFEQESASLAILAEHDAANEHPITETKWRISVFNKMQASANTLLGLAQQILQPISGKITEQRLAPITTLKVGKLRSSVNDEQIRHENLSNEIVLLKPDKSRMLWRLIIYIYTSCVSLFDGCMGYLAFSAARNPFLISAAFGAASTLAIFIGSQVSVWFVMKGTSTRNMRLRALICLAFAAVAFSILGVKRANEYNKPHNILHAANEVVVLERNNRSAGLIAFSAWMFFTTAFVFKLFVVKAKEERKSENLYKAKLQKLAEVKERISGLEIETRAEMKTLEESITYADRNCEMAVGLRKRILGIAEHGFVVYANSYVKHRPNGSCPEFLAHPPQVNIKNFNEI